MSPKIWDYATQHAEAESEKKSEIREITFLKTLKMFLRRSWPPLGQVDKSWIHLTCDQPRLMKLSG